MLLDDAIIDTLACARIGRLIAADRITRHLRTNIVRYAYGADRTRDLSDAFVDRMVADDHEAPMLAEFVHCQWCISWYGALFVLAARRLVPRLWDPLARALAMSQVTGMLASHAE
jgi:uncharacterized protein DUF1360